MSPLGALGVLAVLVLVVLAVTYGVVDLLARNRESWKCTATCPICTEVDCLVPAVD